MTINRSERSERDLLDIWLTVATDNPPAATRLLHRIEQLIDLLADHPFAGPARPELGLDRRALFVGQYLVVYRVEGSSVMIVRVIHGRRDLRDLTDD